MMIGEPNHSNPTVHIPPWSFPDDPTSPDSFYNLQRFLPSNNFDTFDGFDGFDGFSSDQFRMYDFKVRKCTRGRSHDWTECPFAHPGEKARRRDPRKFNYSGTACPDYRKGGCQKADGCEFSHGVFECWLHPARYRTQPCKDGVHCKRRVCFFAHAPEQLRVLSPRGGTLDSPTTESPPMSPVNSGQLLSRSLGSGSGSVNEMVASLRQLQLNKVKVMSNSWGLEVGCSPGIGSPRIQMIRPGFCSLPSTPTRVVTRSGIGYFDSWEEEPVMERVESGRNLRAKMFEKLSKENSLDSDDPGQESNSVYIPNPDVGWVSDLLQ